MSLEVGMTPSHTREDVPSPVTREDIRLLIIAFTPEDKYVYAGKITRDIEKATGAYISPNGIGRIISRELGMIKRLWTPYGWKYIRRITLDDYIEEG